MPSGRTMKAEGKLKATVFWIIPLLLGFSNNKVASLKTDKINGKFYMLHVTPFIGVALIIPKFLLK